MSAHVEAPACHSVFVDQGVAHVIDSSQDQTDTSLHRSDVAARADMHGASAKFAGLRRTHRPAGAGRQGGLPGIGHAGSDGRPAFLWRLVGLDFFAVSDVDAAKAAALHRGAKLLLESHTIPHRGRAAIFADPQGAVFAILASSSIDPADVLAAPGEWIWSSLLTRDPDAAAAFYQDVFGYEVFDLGKEGDIDHLMLSSGNFARASVNTLPSS